MSAASAQTMDATPPVVIGMNNFVHATANLEKTTAFYRDIFGLDQPPPPRPPNPAVPALIGVPGAQLQVRIFPISGAFGFELTHFGAIELKDAQGRPTDPGVASLSIRVRDLGPVVSAIEKAGAPIVTRETLSITVRDPDGYLVEVVQVSPAADAPATGDAPVTGNILGASMGLAVSDLERTRRFYRDLLGFELRGDSRQLAGNVPGTKARMEFHEFSRVPRTPFHLRVADLVSTGGVPAQFSPTIRNIFVEDPDGFKIELYQVSQ